MVVARVSVHFITLDEYERHAGGVLGIASPENLNMSDPLRCISKHSETVSPILYMLDLYHNYFDMNSEFSIICVSSI